MQEVSYAALALGRLPVGLNIHAKYLSASGNAEKMMVIIYSKPNYCI